jgi:hypothetical protein
LLKETLGKTAKSLVSPIPNCAQLEATYRRGTPPLGEADPEATCFRRPKAPRRANKTSSFVGIAGDGLSA